MNILKNIARKFYQLKTSYFPNNAFIIKELKPDSFIMDNNIAWASMFFIIYNSNLIYEINFCDDGTSIMTKKMALDRSIIEIDAYCKANSIRNRTIKLA
jgi:hypothetical protein